MSEVLDTFDKEMPGILSWAVQGCLFWQSGGLGTPDSVLAATKEYKSEQDLLQQFLDERTEAHPDYSVVKKELYSEWRNWCEDVGEEQARRRSQTWVTRQLAKRGHESGGHGGLSITGLRLK